MMQVVLRDVILAGAHGVFAEETLAGGSFRVNVVASYQPVQVPVTQLSDTVDYTVLHAIVKQRFAQPTKLLETVASELALEILDKFPQLLSVQIAIEKLNPPIANFQGVVGVSYELKRNRE